jgi:hypothetical protein
MTERKFTEIVKRMEAAGFKPADIQHFIYGQENQPAKEAAYAWDAMHRRLLEYEQFKEGAPLRWQKKPARVRRRRSPKAFATRRGQA